VFLRFPVHGLILCATLLCMQMARRALEHRLFILSTFILPVALLLLRGSSLLVYIAWSS